MQKNVDVFAFGRYCPTSGQKSEEYHIPPKKYREFMDICHKKFAEHKANGCKTTFQLKDHLGTLYLYKNGLFRLPENSGSNMIYDGCHCGTGHMTIIPTGDVYACRRMESRIGNVFEKPLYDLFMGAEQTVGQVREMQQMRASGLLQRLPCGVIRLHGKYVCSRSAMLEEIQ